MKLETSPSTITTSSTGNDEITIIEQRKLSEPYTIFTKPQIFRILTIASLTSMISPLTASIYLPALNQIESVVTYMCVLGGGKKDLKKN